MTAHLRATGGRNRDDPPERTGWSVIHTRGAGVRQLAELLAVGTPFAVTGELRQTCIDARADLLVGRSIMAHSPISQAAPVGVDPERIRWVVAAVGTGPHSPLAARTAARLAAVLGVPGRLLAASRRPDDDKAAQAALDRCTDVAEGLEPHLIRVSNYPEIVDSMPPDALLVLGTPGGSWVKRRFSGPGKRMAAATRAGAVIVRAEPVRAFQRAEASTVFGPQMLVGDALRLIGSPVVAIAHNGVLVGLVRPSKLADADPAATVGSVMEPPISVPWDAPVSATIRAARELGGAPVPVIGPEGLLIGAVQA